VSRTITINGKGYVKCGGEYICCPYTYNPVDKCAPCYENCAWFHVEQDGHDKVVYCRNDEIGQLADTESDK
jgi:hypothetical protein